MENKTRTGQILKTMLVLTYVVFIGLMIQAGSIIVSYVVSYTNPEAASKLYVNMDFYNLRRTGFWQYSLAVFFPTVLILLKALMAYLVIKTLSKVNLINPFKIEVALIIEKISLVLLVASFMAMFSNVHTNWLLKGVWADTGENGEGVFIFMAGLVFIISQIFKRGVEIQAENDLTV